MTYLELPPELSNYSVGYYRRADGDTVIIVNRPASFGNATIEAVASKLETIGPRDSGRLFSIPPAPPKEPA